MGVAELAAGRLCHHRKVKCDKSRPGCRRCVRYGQPCPGYQKPVKTIFFAYEPSYGPGPTTTTAITQRTTYPEQRSAQHAGQDTTESDSSSSPDTTYEIPEQYVLGNIWPNNGCDSDNMTLYTPVSPRDMHRQRFLMNFLHMHSKGDSIALFHNSELNDMPNIEISSPAVQAALDTLCYVGVGTAYHDQRLLREARIRYSSAITLLSCELNVAPRKTRFRSAVSGMMILRLCELFDTFTHSTKNDRGWHLHLHAVVSYMKACGPQDLLKTEYDWKLFQTVRFCSLYLDIARRKPSMFEKPEWRAMTKDRAKIDAGVALYDLRAPVPGLLARADALIENTTLGHVGLSRLLDNLYSDQQSLRDDFENWMQTCGTNGYEVLHLSPDSPSLMAEEPFNTYYHFKSVSHASLCTTFWMLSLTLSSSILRLLYRFPTSIFRSVSQPSGCHDDGYATALNLYRAAYWCCRPEVAQSPYVGTFHLEFARAYYERAGFCEEVNCCDRMMDSIKISFAAMSDEAIRVESLLAALSQKAAADRFSSGVLGMQEQAFSKGGGGSWTEAWKGVNERMIERGSSKQANATCAVKML